MIKGSYPSRHFEKLKHLKPIIQNFKDYLDLDIFLSLFQSLNVKS